MTESITIRQAKRMARYYAQDGQVGYVVKAADVLHATTSIAAIEAAYGERFQGIVWSTAQ